MRRNAQTLLLTCKIDMVMITRQISKRKYLLMVGDGTRRVKVATLDGVPVFKGVAMDAYIVEEHSGYTLYYQKDGAFYETLVKLRTPDGSIVDAYDDEIDYELTYAAERPGKYPDTQDTLLRFRSSKTALVTKGNMRKFPEYVRERIKSSESVLVHCYPGEFYALDDGTAHCDRYRCIDLEYKEEELTFWTLDEAEDYLFDLFMLYGCSF
jgi:hypothetical protein